MTKARPVDSTLLVADTTRARSLPKDKVTDGKTGSALHQTSATPSHPVHTEAVHQTAPSCSGLATVLSDTTRRSAHDVFAPDTSYSGLATVLSEPGTTTSHTARSHAHHLSPQASFSALPAVTTTHGCHTTRFANGIPESTAPISPQLPHLGTNGTSVRPAKTRHRHAQRLNL